MCEFSFTFVHVPTGHALLTDLACTKFALRFLSLIVYIITCAKLHQCGTIHICHYLSTRTVELNRPQYMAKEG